MSIQLTAASGWNEIERNNLAVATMVPPAARTLLFNGPRREFLSAKWRDIKVEDDR